GNALIEPLAMNPNVPAEETTAPPAPAPPPEPPPSTVPSFSTTPWSWRLSIAAGISLLLAAAYLTRDLIGLRGQAAVGILFFFGLVAAFSSNLLAVNWRTIVWGFVLQGLLGVLLPQTG